MSTRRVGSGASDRSQVLARRWAAPTGRAPGPVATFANGVRVLRSAGLRPMGVGGQPPCSSRAAFSVHRHELVRLDRGWCCLRCFLKVMPYSARARASPHFCFCPAGLQAATSARHSPAPGRLRRGACACPPVCDGEGLGATFSQARVARAGRQRRHRRLVSSAIRQGVGSESTNTWCRCQPVCCTNVPYSVEHVCVGMVLRLDAAVSVIMLLDAWSLHWRPGSVVGRCRWSLVQLPTSKGSSR